MRIHAGFGEAVLSATVLSGRFCGLFLSFWVEGLRFRVKGLGLRVARLRGYEAWTCDLRNVRGVCCSFLRG